jgi:hypothetical protein
VTRIEIIAVETLGGGDTVDIDGELPAQLERAST